MEELNAEIKDDAVTGGQRVWSRRFWFGLGCLLVLRIAYLAVFPLDLIADEAYYWDWSRQLDWCYYSKPPMVAWLIALATGIGGSSPFVVRLPAALLGTGGLAFVYLLGKHLYDERVGCLSAAVVAATPGAALGALLMTIDAPFLFCWVASLFSFWRMLSARGRRRGYWLLFAMAATGCGLLSKQTMLAIFPLAGCFLLFDPDHRREFFRPAFWCWCIGSLAFLVPALWWNTQHDWVTFGHTAHHFNAETVTIGKRIARSLEFIGGQAGAVSPVTFGLVGFLAVVGIMRFRLWGSRERYLYCFCGPPLLGVLVLSLKQRIEPNWPAAFYGSGIILAVAWATASLREQSALCPPRLRTIRTQLIVGLLTVAGLYATPFVVPRTPWHGSRLDPTVRLRGWRELGRNVASIHCTLPDGDQTPILAATGRGPVSELAFYLPGQPRIHQWKATRDVSSQYDLWKTPPKVYEREVLIVTDGVQAVPAELAGSFQKVIPAGRMTIPLGGNRERRFSLWLGVRHPGRDPIAASRATQQHVH